MTEPLITARGGGSYEEGAEGLRSGEPAEPARRSRGDRRTICFLFSDDASFITGTQIVADGGETAA